jgi:hypothetical protein
MISSHNRYAGYGMMLALASILGGHEPRIPGPSRIEFRPDLPPREKTAEEKAQRKETRKRVYGRKKKRGY